MSKSKALTFVVAVLMTVCILTPASLLAQSQASTGQLAGSVKDAAGAVIPNAGIEVVNLETGLKQTATTNAEGLYRIVLLPPGRYRVTASAPGFASASGEATVGVGRTMDVNLALAVGTRKEVVTVSAEMIEATRHENSAFVNATVVSNIPLNGRRFQDIALTTPTAQVDPQRGQITLSGQRMVNTGSINVDGVDYGQLFFGGIKGGERSNFAPTIPLDSIQEFQIVRAGYSAEFGRSTGGTITAITKSGSNEFHGSAGYVIRHEGLGKNNEYYETVKAQLTSQGCSTCVVNPNPTLMQWGGSIGGPVKKDKFFIFGSYDQQRQRIPHQIFFSRIATFAPTAATQEGFSRYKSLEAPFEQTNDAWLFMIKADYQFSNKHRFSGRYNHSNYEGKNAVSVGSSLAPTLANALSNNGTELDSTRTVVGQLTSFFGNLGNEFRGQYARETRPRPANALEPTVTNAVGNFGTTNFLGQNLEYDYRIQFANNLTWLKGSHTAKFGIEYNHIFATQTFGFNQFGVFSSTTSDIPTVLSVISLDPTNPNDHRFDSTTARYNRQIGNLQATMTGEQIAFFAQDSWRVRPTFTLNYGLRWEAALNPKPDASNSIMTNAVRGFVFPSGFVEDPGRIPNQLTQLAPRVGFAWDPFKNGKTVIRGFSGIYFAATPLLLYAGPVNNFRDPPGDLSIQLPISVPVVPTGQPATGTCSTAAIWYCNTVYKQLNLVGVNLDAFTLDKLPVVTIDQMKTLAGIINTAQGKSFNPFNGAQPIFVENTYHNPRSYQAGFGIEHELQKGWTVAVEGTWIKSVFLQRNRELNLAKSTSVDAAGRPLYSTSSRPVSSLGSIQARDSSSKGLYRGLTVRTNMNRRWAQFIAYYTFSENISDDDNERDAGGVSYVDSYNFAPEYSFSRLDRKHQFVAHPVFFLPWQFEVSSSIRLLSGAPVAATFGSDANTDNVNNDRPYWAVGVPFKRNSFHDRALTFIDLRVQKGITIKEKKQIKLSAEMFNLFNLMNMTYNTTAVTNFCMQPNSTTSIPKTCGIPSFQGNGLTGTWLPNVNFLQLRDQNPSSAVFGKPNTSNNVGVPFEAQFSARFIF